MRIIDEEGITVADFTACQLTGLLAYITRKHSKDLMAGNHQGLFILIGKVLEDQ
jgi:hypothetical protein